MVVFPAYARASGEASQNYNISLTMGQLLLKEVVLLYRCMTYNIGKRVLQYVILEGKTRL